PEAVVGVLGSAQALSLALCGGVGSLWGPVIGAMLLVPLAEGLNAELGDVLPGIQGVVYGIAIIMIILWAPEGVYWRVLDRLPRRRATAPDAIVAGPADAAAPVAFAPLSRPAVTGSDLLVLRGIGLSFGG